VIDGHLHRGARGTGGEPGHLLLGILPDGEPATLEYLTCGDALVRNYRSLGGESRPGTEIGTLALQEPASIAGRAAATLGNHLGQGLASLANLLDPERFVIGGGLADLGDRILGPARDALARYALPVFRNVPVLPAALGTRSSLVGAACVALTALEGENIVR
jgi:glucokinase